MGFGQEWKSDNLLNARAQPTGKKVAGQNQKVRGATKVNEWGEAIVQVNHLGIITRTEKQYREQYPQALIFDSRLELFCYNCLKEAGITFEMKIKYVILPAVETTFELLPAMVYTPDFVTGDFWIDTKGYVTKDFEVREKLIKRALHAEGSHRRLLLLKNQKEILAVMPFLQSRRPDAAVLELEVMHRMARKERSARKKATKPVKNKIKPWP